MRVVIHGGMHKTATTTLQQMLYRNRGLLASHGIIYPDIGYPHHSKLVITKIHNWTPDGCQAELAKAQAAGATTLLLSSEAVSTLSATQFRRLISCFRGHDTHIVYCFRHWLEFLPSRWAQNSSRRDSQTFEKYLETVTAPSLNHIDCWFDAVLDRAVEDGECKVSAIAYCRAASTEQGVIAAILAAMSFPESLVAALLTSLATIGQRFNTRRGWALNEVIRLLNGVVADRRGLPQDELCRAIGASRTCDFFFDLHRNVKKLDPALRAELLAAVELYRTTRTIDIVPAIAEADSRLRRKHAQYFTNTPNGDIGPPRSAALTFAQIDWRQFERAHKPLVDAALNAMVPV